MNQGHVVAEVDVGTTSRDDCSHPPPIPPTHILPYPPTMRRVTLVVVGAVLGCVLAGLGLWLGSNDEPARASGEGPAGATTTTEIRAEPTLSEPKWTEEGGIRFESTVIVVDGIETDERSAVLDYRLFSLGRSGGFFFGGTPLPGVMPELWELVTVQGDVIEAVSDAPRVGQLGSPEPVLPGVADSVRFEVEEGQLLGEVAAVRVTGWRVAVPAESVVELAGTGGASAELYDGTTMQIQTILEQRTGALIDFDLQRPVDPWRVTIDQGFAASTEFVGEGPGWRRASSTISGVGPGGGITGFQLVWHEPTAPEIVRVRASFVSWEPLDGEVTVWSNHE